VGLLHGRGHDRAAARLEPGDPVQHEALVRARVHLADPEVFTLEGEHTDFIAGTQELDGRRAASLAISIFSPPIDPDLSITSIRARLGFSFSFSKSLRTGKISSIVVL